MALTRNTPRWAVDKKVLDICDALHFHNKDDTKLGICSPVSCHKLLNYSGTGHSPRGFCQHWSLQGPIQWDAQDTQWSWVVGIIHLGWGVFLHSQQWCCILFRLIDVLLLFDWSPSKFSYQRIPQGAPIPSFPSTAQKLSLMPSSPPPQKMLVNLSSHVNICLFYMACWSLYSKSIHYRKMETTRLKNLLKIQISPRSY